MARSDTHASLVEDPLFVGATRPAMRWGVPFPAFMFNLVFVMQMFLLTKNLLMLLLCLPIHGVLAMLATRDARFFELSLLWARTGLPGLLGNSRFWRGSSSTHLPCYPASIQGRRRRAEPDQVVVS